MSIGTIATVSMTKSTAEHNVAGGSGGMLHLSSVMAATLQEIDATSNKAGTFGGAVAVLDATRTKVTLTHSTIRSHTAGDSGGGLFVEDSVMSVVGVELSENSAERGNGGAVATTGTDTFLEISDTECINIDVLLDWTTAGEHGCQPAYESYTCDPLIMNFLVTCAELEQMSFIGTNACNGCPCNDGYVVHAITRVASCHLMRTAHRIVKRYSGRTEFTKSTLLFKDQLTSFTIAA